jgi:SAM-dependent methyltransferase
VNDPESRKEAYRAAWIDRFATHGPTNAQPTVLDLGCGLGFFTPALAYRFGGRVRGVDSHQYSIDRANEIAHHDAVEYICGRAEQLPPFDHPFDLVLLFKILHYMSAEQQAAAAAEIAHVLRPGGRVLIHEHFADRYPCPTWQKYSPRADELVRNEHVCLGETVERFTAAGLTYRTLDDQAKRLSGSLSDELDRLNRAKISCYGNDDAEIEQGFAALRQAADEERARYEALGGEPPPVTTTSDLLVLELPE